MIRTALVGCGRHMNDTLIRYLRQIPDVVPVLCVDPDTSRAKRLSALVGASSSSDSIFQVQTGVIDAAIVATPPAAARMATSYLIGHGIPTFVEKPPAESTAAMRTLLDEAAGAQALVQVGYNYRHADAVRAFLTATEAGRRLATSGTIDFRSKH